MNGKLFKKGISYLIIILSISFPSKSQSAIIYTKSSSPYYISADFIVENQDTIIIEAGATLIISPEVNILTNGVLMMNGTSDDPASILPEIEGIGWGMIEINCPGKTSYLQHANIVDGIILSWSCHMTLDHVTFTNNQDISWMNPIMFVRDASVQITNSSIYGSDRGEGFQMLNSPSVLVKDCFFSKIPDAVEVTNVTGGVIRHNWFENIPDDAIDLNNCSNTLIDSNMIINVIDRGMELGSENNGNSENIVVTRNVLIHCNEGIILKENSNGQIINNTFFANNIGLSCIENNTSKTGSSAEVQNCIFSGSIDEDIFHDANSEVLLSYCLSDQNQLAGEHNLLDDPLFINAADYNFNLRENSPCINKGNPQSPPDPDNTVSDIGAFYYNTDTTGIIEQEDTFRQIQVYPNPFNEDFTIRYPDSRKDQISVELFDLLGQKITVSIQKQTSPSNQLLMVKPRQRIKSKGIVVCKISVEERSKLYLLIHN